VRTPPCNGYLEHQFDKRGFGLSSPASFSLSGELSPRSRRGIVLIHKGKQGGLSSRLSRKACMDYMRKLQKTSSAMTLRAGWTWSTSCILAHTVSLQAAQR
jgi:hypothetical protein